jgi:hypothetical protein
MARQETKNKEITGGELTDCPNEQYRKFFEKFKEIETLDVNEWKPVHLLGYFCKKYKETYDVDYKFKFNSPSPSKCFEVFQIKKLAYSLTEQPRLLKEYIDWIYLNKVVKAKRRLTSISFMTNDGIMSEYKFNVLLSGKKNINVNRSTALPEQYKMVFQEAGLSISTYGEMAFVSQMSELSQELVNAFSQIESLGFDKEMLERIV